MNIQPGNGIYLKLPHFADGGGGYKRPLLVVNTEESEKRIFLLNVSSIKGKEHKLIKNSNELLLEYNPPFRVPSFVKLDVLYILDYFDDLSQLVFRSGLLNFNELTRIQDKLKKFSQNNRVAKVYFNEELIRQANQI